MSVPEAPVTATTPTATTAPGRTKKQPVARPKTLSWAWPSCPYPSGVPGVPCGGRMCARDGDAVCCERDARHWSAREDYEPLLSQPPYADRGLTWARLCTILPDGIVLPAEAADFSSFSSPPSGDENDENAHAGVVAPATRPGAHAGAGGIAARLAAATATLGALRGRYSAEVEYLAEPYVALAEVLFVVGAPESMKSWLLADLGRAVATGGLWLGSIRVRRGKVIYFEQERAKNLVYQTSLLEKGWGVDLSGITTVEPCGIDLCHPEWQAAIIAQVEAGRPVLVVFNSYRAIFRGRPPDSSDVAYALGWLGALANRVNCTIAVVDATNKGGIVGRLRGAEAHGDSGQKTYEADTILHLERKRNELGRGTGPTRAYLGKQRYGDGQGDAAPPPFVFDVLPFKGGAPFSSFSSPLGGDENDEKPKPDGVRVLWLDETTVEQDAPPATRTGADRVYDALREGETRSITDLAAAAGLTYGSTANVLGRLLDEGRAEAPERGQWRRRSAEESAPPPRRDDDDAGPALPPPGTPCARCQEAGGDTPAVRYGADGRPLCEPDWRDEQDSETEAGRTNGTGHDRYGQAQREYLAAARKEEG